MPRRLAIGAILCVMAGVASAPARAASAVEVRARDSLTANATLRGTMTFTVPPAWKRSRSSGVYTARFVQQREGDCRVEIDFSIRGKATKRTPEQQADIGSEPLEKGARRDGVYLIGWSGPATLYGIAVVRVEKHRYGHLRTFATFKGSGCRPENTNIDENLLAPLVRALRTSRSALRVETA
jgi:hypothetical protein